MRTTAGKTSSKRTPTVWWRGVSMNMSGASISTSSNFRARTISRIRIFPNRAASCSTWQTIQLSPGARGPRHGGIHAASLPRRGPPDLLGVEAVEELRDDLVHAATGPGQPGGRGQGVIAAGGEQLVDDEADDLGRHLVREDIPGCHKDAIDR